MHNMKDETYKEIELREIQTQYFGLLSWLHRPLTQVPRTLQA